MTSIYDNVSDGQENSFSVKGLGHGERLTDYVAMRAVSLQSDFQTATMK
jgi:hypothetical protein